MNTDTLLHGLGYGATYSAVGLAMLMASLLVIDVLTPGHLGSHLRPIAATTHTVRKAGSQSAGLVTAAWLLGHGLIIFTSIWRNAESGFGSALVSTIAFGLVGMIALTLAYLVVDALTPGRLGDAVCEPGGIQPLAVVLSGALLAMSAIICASIA